MKNSFLLSLFIITATAASDELLKTTIIEAVSNKEEPRKGRQFQAAAPRTTTISNPEELVSGKQRFDEFFALGGQMKIRENEA